MKFTQTLSIYFILLVLLGCQHPVEMEIKPENVFLIDENNSPYYIYEELTIEEGDILMITEGAEIFLDTSVNIISYGEVVIKGSAENPVHFKPIDETIGWGCLRVKKEAGNLTIENAIFDNGTIKSSAPVVHFNHITFNNNQDLVWNDAIARFWNVDLLIENCTINGINKGEGFLVHDPVTPPVVTNCTFNSIPDAVEYIGANGGTVSHCVFNNNGDDAVDLNNCRDVVIEYNTMLNIKDSGMEIGSENFGSSIDIIARRNVIVNCKKGIIVKEASSASLEHNTFHLNEKGVAVEALAAEQMASEVQIINSVFYENDVPVVKDNLSVADVINSLCDDVLMDGTDNIMAEPQFIDAANRNYNLTAQSPCIDAGYALSPKDPDGTIADIGAFYYSQ